MASFPLKGEGRDGGESVEMIRLVFEDFTPTPTLPLAGGGSQVNMARPKASATSIPSTPADMIPPAYPAPSPAGYSPFTFRL
jgi:hypothetical protein